MSKASANEDGNGNRENGRGSAAQEDGMRTVGLEILMPKPIGARILLPAAEPPLRGVVALRTILAANVPSTGVNQPILNVRV
jgi:hypothetical protein